MAAYGALVSVMYTIDQIHRHPRPPISIPKEHVESLTANVTFLQEFLEGYNPHVSYTAESDPLESRIAEAAYAAEDVIDSYIVDQIHSRSSSDHVEDISSTHFYQGLQKVIEEMNLIKKEIKEKTKEKEMGVQIIKASSIPSSTAQKVTKTIVGLDEALIEMLDKITGGGDDRQIIPIVGMGGLGKTTLARNMYANPLTMEHFDICAWATISQVHDARKILSEILGQVGVDSGEDLSEYDLGEKLYKHLIGRRYLIVMDDIWSIEAWDVVTKFFPDNENGSRIVITTRLSKLASQFNPSYSLEMKFLDESDSWNLFSKTVFGEEICPLELESIGRMIVEGCRGLPLSIVVIGGLLSKSEATRGNWELIEEKLSSVVNSEDDGSCLQILYTSYNNLPVHLKPCFLYMGVFPDDEEIEVLLIVTLWVAEGFIKPIDGKSLEEAVEEYLEELVARNLLLVETRNHHGKLREVKMHDLVRDVCLREAQKDKFLCVLGDQTIPASTTSQRRITTSFKEEYPPNPLAESEKPTTLSLVRSLVGEFPKTLSISSFRLLRVYLVYSVYGDDEEDSEYSEEESSDEHYEDILIRLVNLRLLLVGGDEPLPRIPSSVSSFWNLQTLGFLEYDDHNYLLEIWKMPLLRHVMSDDRATLDLPDAHLSDDEMDEDVLENLHTLYVVRNLNFSEGVLKRIPNIIKLKLVYSYQSKQLDYYSLHNLRRLHKLQILRLKICSDSCSPEPMRELALPYSLVKLTLENTKLTWEEMASKIGCLPLLQVLKLKEDSFTGSEWETFEGEFLSLKYLLIEDCPDLEYWITDNTHFPRLEHLLLQRVTKLREIPSSIGDIPTLVSIKLLDCCDSTEESAERIAEEQEEYGNELLQIQVNGKSIR